MREREKREREVRDERETGREMRESKPLLLLASLAANSSLTKHSSILLNTHTHTHTHSFQFPNGMFQP